MKRLIILVLALALALLPVGVLADSGLPVSAEPVTLKMWLVSNDTVSQFVDNYEELPFFKEMEARTGIHISIELVPNTTAVEAFNLLIASGDLPDLIMQSESTKCYYTDGLDAAVDDGYFLDITPYLDNLAADYQTARTWDPETEKQTITDDGRVVAFWQCYTEGYQPPWNGMMIRQDWLDELNLEQPVTYDDWYNVLTAFKNEKGATAALQIGYEGHMFQGTFSAGYGVNDTFINVDKKAMYGPVQEGYRQYVEMLAKWYAEGLVDPDFLSGTSIFVPNTSLVASGASGAWADIYTLLNIREGLAEGMKLSPVPTPVQNAGDTVYVGLNTCGTGAGNYTVISTDTKYPELCVKWCNYLYTEEGRLLANYGIEGETYEMVDGQPRFTEYITSNPDGYSFAEAMVLNTLFPSLGCRYEWARETQVLSPKVLSCLDVWRSNFVQDRSKAYLMPSGTSMTQAENTRYAAIMADVETYVKECTTKFITGEMGMDEWDAYVKTIEDNGIEEAAALQQAALDRYYAK